MSAEFFTLTKVLGNTCRQAFHLKKKKKKQNESLLTKKKKKKKKIEIMQFTQEPGHTKAFKTFKHQ